jgi:ferric-dicitrate binding protein FerR (iron transport regulator)
MKNEYIKALLIKLKNNQCTSEEKKLLYDSLSDMQEDTMNEVMEALFFYDKSGVSLNAEDSKRIYDSTISQLEFREPDMKSTIIKGVLWLLASSLVLLLGYLYYKYYHQKTTVRSEYAQQKNIELPDGSLITLNANSQIEYAQHWGSQSPREVYIEGEAYFQVKKNLGYPQEFIVRTKDLSVMVLGTEFNVNTRDDKTSVYLEEGKINVQFKEENDIKTMSPGDKIEYSSKKKKILSSEKGIMPKSETSWKEGVIMFEESNLKEVFKELESIYGISIKYDESLDLQQQITAGIPMKELDIVIPLLSEVLNRKIRKDGKVLTILPK